MKTAKVTIRKCVQDSQDYGSDDEHMVSRVFFDLNIGEQTYSDCYVDIKQTVGGSFENTSIEVGSPQGYKGPYNYEVFRDEVEKYYRGLVGSKGSAIHIAPGSQSIRMHNNQIIKEYTFEFEVDEGDAGW